MNGLLIFDFDGVIADSEVVANKVLAEFVTELGVPTTLQDSYRDYMGNRFSDVMRLIETAIGRDLPDDFPETFQTRTFDRFRRELKPVNGIFGFLDAFQQTRKCIASSSSPDRLALCLELLDLENEFIPNVFSASSVPRGKPHPDIFLAAAEGMQAEPGDCIVIEDSVSGVQAGIAAGMTVIGVIAASHIQPGHNLRLASAGAQFIAGSFIEAETITRRELARIAEH